MAKQPSDGQTHTHTHSYTLEQNAGHFGEGQKKKQSQPGG